MDARSTVPACSSIVCAARRARWELSDCSRNAAENTKNRSGPRPVSIIALLLALAALASSRSPPTPPLPTLSSTIAAAATMAGQRSRRITLMRLDNDRLRDVNWVPESDRAWPECPSEREPEQDEGDPLHEQVDAEEGAQHPQGRPGPPEQDEQPEQQADHSVGDDPAAVLVVLADTSHDPGHPADQERRSQQQRQPGGAQTWAAQEGDADHQRQGGPEQRRPEAGLSQPVQRGDDAGESAQHGDPPEEDHGDGGGDEHVTEHDQPGHDHEGTEDDAPDQPASRGPNLLRLDPGRARLLITLVCHQAQSSLWVEAATIDTLIQVVRPRDFPNRGYITQ